MSEGISATTRSRPTRLSLTECVYNSGSFDDTSTVVLLRKRPISDTIISASESRANRSYETYRYLVHR
jgi:hypothetical protein